jgi:hypothetical protein
MIINIDICGAWAGNADVYPTTGCSGKCTDMVANASNYNNAYWEINYVKTFTAQGNASATAGPSGGGSSTGGPSATGSQTVIATAGPNAAERAAITWWTAASLLVVAVAMLAA